MCWRIFNSYFQGNTLDKTPAIECCEALSGLEFKTYHYDYLTDENELIIMAVDHRYLFTILDATLLTNSTDEEMLKMHARVHQIITKQHYELLEPDSGWMIENKEEIRKYKLYSISLYYCQEDWTEKEICIEDSEGKFTVKAINLARAPELLSQIKLLADYTEFVRRIKDNDEPNKTLEEHISSVIDSCLKENIMSEYFELCAEDDNCREEEIDMCINEIEYEAQNLETLVEIYSYDEEDVVDKGVSHILRK